jgi:hypothetical protein
LWVTLAVLCLVAAGAAYGITRVLRSELELEATADARDLTLDVLEPLVHPKDVQAPVHGPRYEALLASVDERMLKGPVAEVRVWRSDGTIVFATDRDMVGERYPAEVGDPAQVMAGTAHSAVEGDRFRTFTWIRVGDQGDLVAVELVRSHAAIVAGSKRVWHPWIARALVAAATFGSLYALTAIVLAVATPLRRRVDAKRVDEDARASGVRTAWNPTLPDYMRPGFREEVEARRKMEQEMAASHREREELVIRLRRAELEREQAAGRAATTV